MKKLLKVFVIGFISFGSLQLSQAQNQPVFTLNQFDTEEIEKAKAGSEASYFELNSSIFENQELDRGALLDVMMFGGETERMVILDREEYMPGTVSFRAHKVGAPDQIFAFTYGTGKLNGIYYTDGGKPMYFNHDLARAKNFISPRNEYVEHRLVCGVDHSDELIPTPHIHHNHVHDHNTSQRSVSSAAPLISTEDDSVAIDLMIVYTQAAEDWASTSQFGSIEAVISQAMNLSQTALNNSNANIDLRLVNTTKTSYDEETDGVDASARLSRLTQNDSDPVFNPGDGHNGFMEEVHPIRDNVGADVVALFSVENNTGGLGWRLGSAGGDPYFGFNLNRVQQVATGYTLLHEIGHNMGNAHSRTQSSAAAGDEGGLFQYSVGFQNTTASYHTVMSYSDNGQEEAPIFSSPDLTYLGSATGSASSLFPSDNARSIRLIKRTVSNYRTTNTDSPSAEVSANSINIEMNREDNQNIPFQISNDGQSLLVWDIDFRFNSLPKRAKNTGETFAAADFSRVIKAPANYSGLLASKKKGVAEETIYTTSFEAADGFVTGNFGGIQEWRSTSGDEFEISASNPNTGSRHLRVSGDGTQSTRFISAPFFGYQLFGEYEIIVNFSVSTTDETFDIYVSDGNNGEFTAGVIMANQTIFAADDDEQGGVGFFGTGVALIPNQYHELKMIVNPDDQEINYLLNGVTIANNEYVGGFSPGEMLILNRSTINGSTFDIDDIEIKKISAPYPWLNLSEQTGFSVQGGASSTTLQFTTVGVAAGVYTSSMRVRTNDPQNQEFSVPITLTVANVVSNEPEDTPSEISLSQNFPNPFNPQTTISYSITNPGEISLAVYNIQGQKVATLYEGVQQAGEFDVTFDASNLSSGIYLYRLQTASEVITKQMALIK